MFVAGDAGADDNGHGVSCGGLSRARRGTRRSGSLQAANRPALLRDLLPSDAGLVYEGALGDDSVLPCDQRRHKLQLSRVGLSRDGRWGVVSYGVYIPTTAPMCGTGYGAAVVVRRQQDGTWVIDRPLYTVIS